jgi:hypothetical protein
MVFISLRVVRVSCQITQNDAVDASLGAEVVLGAELPLGAELSAGVELPVADAVPAGVELPAGDALPQADSARAKAGVSNRVASNVSRPVAWDVRFMPL